MVDEKCLDQGNGSTFGQWQRGEKSLKLKEVLSMWNANELFVFGQGRMASNTLACATGTQPQ